jgi:ubiquinone/menaquinone biosynthesis C-methylase UbiE
MNEQQHALDQARNYWNDEAAAFDQEADHGLRDVQVREAWRQLLQPYLPSPPASCLDIGCGTGSLSLLLAELGYAVTGVDFAPAMIAQAQQKAMAAGQAIAFRVMEAANPSFPPAHFDLVLCRHVLWALPDPAAVLQRWVRLLRPQGRLLLIEGFWHTGGGLHQTALLAALPATLTTVRTQDLSIQPLLWGGAVADERYLIAAEQS